MAYCKVHQAEIYYEEMGQGIPILMIHGYSPDHRLMTGCMEPIFTNREGWRRIYIDLPGMGLTRNYHDISCSDEMLNAVLEFINIVIPDQEYLIVGESYGGYIARGIIEKQPERILGAAFICPVINPSPENRQVEVHDSYKIDNNFINKWSKDEQAEFRDNQVVLNEYTWLRYNNEIVSGIKISDEEFLNKVKKQYGFSFKLDQSHFTKPSLFLLGRQDSTVGYKDALSLTDTYSRGTFTVIDTAGHNLQIDQPQIFNHVVNEWLDRVLNDFLSRKSES